MSDIEVGDRVTLKDGSIRIITDESIVGCCFTSHNNRIFKNEIIKIERPKYEVIEEKKELLTEEEKEFLRQYIKIIENLNNGEVKEIFRGETYLRLYLKTKLDYKIEIGTKFSNMKQERAYTLEELGL